LLNTALRGSWGLQSLCGWQTIVGSYWLWCNIGWWSFMALSPSLIEILTAPVSLQVDGFVVLSSMVSLRQELLWRASLCTVLVRWAGDLLAGPLDVAKISLTHIGLFWCQRDHGKGRCSAWNSHKTWLDRLRLGMDTAKVSRIIAVDYVTVVG